MAQEVFVKVVSQAIAKVTCVLKSVQVVGVSVLNQWAALLLNQYLCSLFQIWGQWTSGPLFLFVQPLLYGLKVQYVTWVYG